jgi:type II secretory pathway pseudopilin PulG
MTTHTPTKFKRSEAGFTLVEVVIALGILVVMITGFMAVFGPAARTIKKTLSTDEASRLQATLELELRTVREGRERRRFQGDPFQKAIDWIAQSEEQGQTVIIYKYRGIPGQFRQDGTLEPADRSLAIAGRDFIVQPMVRRISDPFFEEDLQAVEGRVFFVKLRQLVFEGQGLRVTDQPGTIVDPNVPGQDFAQNPQAYPEAVIAFEAEYYSLPTTTFAYLSNAFDPNNFNRPIFSRNLVVRR